MRLLDVATRPEENETVVLAVNQRREHGSWESGIIEFHRQVLAACIRGPLPCSAELGLASEDAEIGGLVGLFDSRCYLDLEAAGRGPDRSGVTIFRFGGEE